VHDGTVSCQDTDLVCATEVSGSTLGKEFICFSNTTEDKLIFCGLKFQKVR
jgi:hypothetical protein